MNLYIEHPPTLGGSYIGSDSKEGCDVLKNILFTLLDADEYKYQCESLHEWGLATLSWDHLDYLSWGDSISREHFLSIINTAGFSIKYFTEKEMPSVQKILYKGGGD